MKDCNGLVCYFPTTIMLLDDNRRFASAIQENLAYDIISTIQDNPEQALKEICTRENNNNSFLNWHLSNQNIETANPYYTFTNYLNDIYKIIYNPKRFERITVLVVDNEMPNINGLEFCEKLKDLPIKKIILTSSANLNSAATAFNNGIIHHFVLKDSPNLCKELSQAIHNLQLEYFRNFSKTFINNLPESNKINLSDPVLMEFFNYVCHMKHASEFYLLDNLGSFLLMDFSGNPLWLIIRNEESMLNFGNVAIQNNAPPKIIHAIENKLKIPFSLTTEEAITNQLNPLINWDSSLHPATKLAGKKDNYYYALLNDRTIGNLDFAKILSHRGYLAKINIFL